VIERFFDTLKERLLWLKNFENVDLLSAALHEFQIHYNKNWIIQRHKYRTPTQVRDE